MHMLTMLPQAHWDAMLLRMFPGKPLEETDGIDWTRLMRAMQAQEIERIEDLHDMQFKGTYKPTPDEWRKIMRHNRLEDNA